MMRFSLTAEPSSGATVKASTMLPVAQFTGRASSDMSSRFLPGSIIASSWTKPVFLKEVRLAGGPRLRGSCAVRRARGAQPSAPPTNPVSPIPGERMKSCMFTGKRDTSDLPRHRRPGCLGRVRNRSQGRGAAGANQGDFRAGRLSLRNWTRRGPCRRSSRWVAARKGASWKI